VGDHRWQEPTEDECRRLLGERHLGRLALVDADGPVILPVNYALDQGSVVFRLERLRALPLYPWAPGAKAHYVRLRPASVTGRRIALPADLPFTRWG
jgi:hypothetical protein